MKVFSALLFLTAATLGAAEPPAALPLWKNGAPGSEARAAEAERLEGSNVVNVHNPSITPYLPARDKMTAPRYQDIPPDRIPLVRPAPGVEAKVIAGALFGARGLVEAGAHVKATGFSRTDHDVPATLRAIASANPAALLFGTDLPSTRAPRPFEDADVEIVRENAGERALWQNAADLYLR